MTLVLHVAAERDGGWYDQPLLFAEAGARYEEIEALLPPPLRRPYPGEVIMCFPVRRTIPA